MNGRTSEDVAAGSSTRRSFLTKSACVGAVVLPGVFGASHALADDNNSRDVFVDIRSPRLMQRNFEAIQKHENDHVAFLKNALGPDARPKPTFKGLEQATLKRVALLTRAFENTGVGAYLGAAPKILSRDILASAGSIATIEARHAGFINVALGFSITQSGASFESPLGPAQVQRAVAPYIQSLNGGPPLTYSSTPSAVNDIAILNFALALEYLEAEFYNINVPKFF